MNTKKEKDLEKNFIKLLENQGYEYRKDIKTVDSLERNFKCQLEELNDCTFTDSEFNRILFDLDSGDVFDRSEILRNRYHGKKDNDDDFYIDFFNKDDWDKNCFQVINQINVSNDYDYRYDVTILVNGLPLVQIELKRLGESLEKAFDQILEYKKYSYPKLFGYIQLFVISNEACTEYFANNEIKKLNKKSRFRWMNFENEFLDDLTDFTKSFFDKENLFRMIFEYMVLRKEDKDNSLIVLRPYQKYAVEAIKDQVSQKKDGYIWHATGSGKTLTTYIISKLLSRNEQIDKIIILVDRKDLDFQTSSEFNNFEEDSITTTSNTKELVEYLKDNSQYKVILTIINKLYDAVTDYRKDLDEIKDENIILIYDECHRGHFGDRHHNITSFFNNSLNYGFTGTPIFKDNAKDKEITTDKVFGKCLHKYLIMNAIENKNILKFLVTYYDFIKKTYNDNIDIEKLDLDPEDRRKQIVEDIINNYDRLTNNRKFNAIFTVDSTDNLQKYYDIFQSKEHTLKIATIFSKNESNKEKLNLYIKDYNDLFGTEFSLKSFNEYNRDISRRMKNREINLLLVVDMYLTGFDSKKLNTLFVDKKLKYHGLLQSFSRTNRPFDNSKLQGNIISYQYLKDEVYESMLLFSLDHPEGIFVSEYQELSDKFEETSDSILELGTINSINKEEFVSLFKELLMLRRRLLVYKDFSFENYNLTEEDFERYKSIYLRFYSDDTKVIIEKNNPSNNGNRSAVKETNNPSVIDINYSYVDSKYTLEVIDTETIDEKFIFVLIKNYLMGNLEEYEVLSPSYQLFPQNKEFFEKFINSLKKEDQDLIKEKLFSAIKKEKDKRLDNIIENENLKPDKLKEIYQIYEENNQLDNDDIKSTFNEKFGLAKRYKKILRVKKGLFDVKLNLYTNLEVRLK